MCMHLFVYVCTSVRACLGCHRSEPLPLAPLQQARDDDALDRVDDDGIDQDFGGFEGFARESREVGSVARREDVNGTIVDFGGEDAIDAESSGRNGSL
jgi:hypothetical protein